MFERHPQNPDLIKGYHTQEHRGYKLKKPIYCDAQDAWLGPGYYFWIERQFADYWGIDYKCKQPHFEYEVSEAWLNLNPDHTLNTTFSEFQYRHWVELIETAISQLKDNADDVTLFAVHKLVSKVLGAHAIFAIIYDDLPHRPGRNSELNPLFYKKRIQVVVFNEDLIADFRYIEHKRKPRQ